MAQSEQQQPVDDWEYRLRKYLLLLASLAATVTYAAGLDPPGGSWAESDAEKMAVAGNSILRATHHNRYLAFYYSNATAFAASLVVILLLLVLPDKKDRRPEDTIHLGAWPLDLQTHLRVLRIVMVLDLLALMVAYTAGSCRDKVTTIYTAALVTALSIYVGIHNISMGSSSGNYPDQNDQAQALPPPTSTGTSPDQNHQAQAHHPPTLTTDTDLEQVRKVLMLLAIFAATITYNAGLNPPGGFWEHANGLHRPGEVILKHKHGRRFTVFFFCNTAAFIASLVTVVLLLDKKLTKRATSWRLGALSGFVLVTLVTIVAAYAAGSCRNTATTTYTVALVAAVLVSIFLAAVAGWIGKLFMEWLRGEFRMVNGGEPDRSLKEMRSIILLLGTLAASVTYQAGLNPPGGVWLENSSGSHGHNAGDPILLNTDEKRYSIFFYLNSTSFVASILVILMVQIKALLKPKALHFAMILDLLGLMGAYIAGSSRTLRASVHLIVVAAAFLVYVTVIYLHVMKKSTPDPADDAERRSLKKRRKRLLLFAILMATITYQAGLNPPGGFWREEQQGGRQGSPILEEMYHRRYQAFFYCNAMSFMASIALIFLLQGDKTYQPEGFRFYGLYACMLVGMLVLMGAYAAGSARRLKTSIYVLVLVGGVSAFILLLLALFLRKRPRGPQRPQVHRVQVLNANNDGGGAVENAAAAAAAAAVEKEIRERRKHVMLLAMLAASVTYQAGLDPPGGVWPEGYAAGSPVLHDSNLHRYHAFFYSNSSSFVASIVVIILLLRSELPYKQSDESQQQNLLTATNIVVALDLIGLLVAYAAGSSRTLGTSLYIIVLVVVVLIYILVHVRVRLLCDAVGVLDHGPGEGTLNTRGVAGKRRNGAEAPPSV